MAGLSGGAIGAGLAGFGAILKGVTAISQNAKANRIDRANRLPIEQVQSEYFKNVADAENMAQVGTPSQQYNNSINNISRNFAGGLRRFNGRNQSLASMIRASNDATRQIDVDDINNRTRNRFNLFQQRNILAQQKNNVFDWNKKQPYIANLAKAEALRGAGTQNLMGAFNDLSQGGAMMAMNGDGGRTSQAPATSGYAPTSFGQSSAPVGQYGTRLGGMNNNGFGAGYPLPRNPYPNKFIIPFNG